MSISADPGHFFQTETSLATIARRAAKRNNKNGDPIQATSKILALLPDPLNADFIFIAESCGIVRRVDLSAKNIKNRVYRGFTTPVTCLAISNDGRTLYAGAWEKKIIAWDIATAKLLTTFVGHADFVKSLLYLPHNLLLSGSSDANIIIWDATTGTRLGTLKGHTRAVGTMAVDPLLSDNDAAVIFAGGSERDVRRWRIPYADPKAAVEDGDIVREWETSVHCIRFLGDDGDMWGVSADGTARRVDGRTPEKVGGEVREGWRTDTLLKHADYVNDIVMSRDGRWVVTACRDEEVRVWDVGSGELYHTFTGHADEVVGLATVGERGEWLVSVGIDCTIRKWPLTAVGIQKAKEEARKLCEEGPPEPKVEKKGLLTLEEEAELAELMEDSD